MNHAILLPAKNEEAGLPRVLPGCLLLRPPSAILVVDDGSTDGTSRTAESFGVPVLALRPGRGKGGALRAGFARLLAEGFDAVVTIDSDGQHDPSLIPLFVRAAEEGADLVVGARAGAVSAARRIANWASAGALSIASGQRVRDAQSGYRLHTARLLRALPLTGERFEFETEVLAGALCRGFRVAFVPIPTLAADRPSHIHPVKDVVPLIAQHALLAVRILAARAAGPSRNRP